MTDLATTNPTDDFTMLDIYGEGATADDVRIDALATLSAGYKEGKLPKVSRNGVMYLHDPEGRAPGLAEALEATDGKALNITFPFDNPADFISQRFARYSATRLEVYGDETELTEIDKDGNRATHPAGSKDFDKLLPTCKVNVSVFFVLIAWQSGEPVITMPDGMGFYRIRFTGRNSLRSFVNQVALIKRFTQGRIAGVPFELRLVNREVSDSKGMRRNIPVFTPVMKAPNMRLSSQNFRGVLQESFRQAEALSALPRPPTETLELAARDGAPLDLDVGEPSEHDMARMASPLDYETELARFFAQVKDTPLDSDEARADMLAQHFEGQSSLREILPTLEPEAWDEFLAMLGTYASREAMKAKERNPKNYGEGVTQAHVDFVQAQLERAYAAGLEFVERWQFIGWAIGRWGDIKTARGVTADHMKGVPGAFGFMSSGGKKFQPLTEQQLIDRVAGFHHFLVSDEAAAGVLE